jgi:predicted dehydrogenase
MIKLGIIGISKGNGHPYSWSAIFNGYNPEAMKDCGFPVISTYLSEQCFPEATITNAEVTHVWAQSREQAEHIALSANIANVVDTPEDMIGEIDALLLARDDSENHLRFARPFIRAGLPVYIDKPLALSKEKANYFFDLEQYPAQIFTCSALRFSNELLLTPEDRAMLGDIKHVSGRVPKGWDKYIIHVIDPILQNIGYQGEILDVSKLIWRDRTLVNLRWGSGITCSLQSFGDVPVGIEIVFVGTGGSKRLTFSDPFSAFKNALQTFIDDSVVNRISHKKHVLKTVELIELGI